jgi:two-component system clock-associated histidine kinase SasA
VADQTIVDSTALIAQAVLDVEPTVKGKYGTVVTDLPRELPSIWVDEDMARRVLINLIENSVKFTPQEGRFEVGARPEDNWVHVWVKDNGPGIPLSEQERIFDKFTRLRSGTRSSGLGIGLAFCRLAVAGHGGRIWVESEPGKGSTFHFTLPVATKEQLANQAGETGYGSEQEH